MAPRTCLLAGLPLALALGCPPLPDFVTCEEAGACDTTGPATTTGDGGPPTTSDGVHTVTGDDPDPDPSSGSTAPAAETGDETSGTTDEPELPPQIVNGVVIPDYIDENGLLDVEVTTEHSEGVTMLLENGDLIELTPVRPGQFAGQIPAFTALDNGKHTVVLTPWREMFVGEPVDAHYVIALPPPGYEIGWQTEDMNGNVVAIAVLPDGRPVDFGTYMEMGAPRCYLRLRDKKGEPVEKLVPVLASAYCRAIDLKIDRDTGRMRVLVERLNGNDTVWWAGESSAWGKGLQNIGIGEVGDTALALAARPDVVAVCGSRAVATADKLDALAVLLRPNEPAEARVFDYVPSNDLIKAHRLAETARDCTFAGDTLVLVGETFGRQDVEQIEDKRDRLMVIESNIAAADDPAWTVAGPDQGIQTRAFALDLDDEGHYHLAGYTCFDVCEPVGKLWTYAPGGKLVDHAWLGPLGSAWFGPHDIAWSPAGYAVVAFGELQGQNFVFKVQAFAPGVALPLWTFLPNDKQGLQLALAVAVGPYGEVYAGGIGNADYPAFARIGS
jgi:hypothetical protein